MSPSLRDDLVGAAGALPVPPFALLLPRGWVSHEATPDTFGDLARRVSAVLRSRHRPDLDARVRTMLERASTELMRRDPVRLILQEGVPPEETVPLSIVIVRTTDPDGAPLDRRVHELVRTRGARPLDDDATILRWSSDGRLQLPDGTATVRSFNYLVAIPGTGRRQALLVTGVLPIAAGETLDDGDIEGVQAFMDAVVSTFQWGG